MMEGSSPFPPPFRHGAPVSLPPGTRFDAYQLVALIGAGGMGEVYLAHDDRLGRDVALKVLPPAFAEDPGRLQRFLREARILASLSHPNIVQVFGSGERDGAPYLVMELLEGETLAERLQGRPLALKRAVDLAREAALGLAAAHERGILHRDIKPANLFITRDGRVKLLDLGLAKSMARHGPPGGTAASESLTEPGLVLGTVGYMSPEQVRGEAQDARSDLFSLGVVLWEMMSGRRPFQRGNTVETLNAILTEDPPDLDPALKVPPALERILMSCLAKDPEARFHSAHDLAFALGGVWSGSQSGSLPAQGGPSARRWRRLLIPLAGAALVLGGLGLARARQWRPFRPPAQPTFRPLTFREGRIAAARFTPDGQGVMLSADWEDRQTHQLYALRLSPRELKATGIRDALLHGISPGGEVLMTQNLRPYAWWTWQGRLGRARLEALSPRFSDLDVLSADLGAQGLVAASRRVGTGAYHLECPLGQVRLDNGSDFSDLRFSPDGGRLAYIEHPHSGDNWGLVGVLDLATGRTRTLTRDFQGVFGLAWRGDEVWFSASEGGPIRSIWAVSMDGRTRLVLRSPGDLTLLDLAPDGRALVASEEATSRLYLVREGIPPQELTQGWYPVPVGMTGPGSHLLYMDPTESRGPAYDLYLQPLPEGPALHLGQTLAYPALSPDATRVATFEGNPTHPVITHLGTGAVRHLPTFGLVDYPYFTYWTADGKTLILTAKRADEEQVRIYLLDEASGDIRPLGPAGRVAGPPDPAGRRLVATVAGQRVILDLARPDAPGTPILGLDPGELVLGWDALGARLILCRPILTGVQVTLLDPASGRRTPWTRFDAPGLQVRRFGAPPRLTKDGRTLVFSNLTWSSTLFLVEGLK